MKEITFKIIIPALIFTAFTCSCNKGKAPKPDEQELITTLKIQLIEEFSSYVQTFEYKVENGFGGSGGVIKIDTLQLKSNTNYDAVLTVLNEKANPIEDITQEIKDKNNEHLFLFNSNPVSGYGSLTTSNGSKDNAGNPFNQTFKITTGKPGKGQFQVVLLHLPTNKNATSLSAAGGETDLDATFPVVLQ